MHSFRQYSQDISNRIRRKMASNSPNMQPFTYKYNDFGKYDMNVFYVYWSYPVEQSSNYFLADCSFPFVLFTAIKDNTESSTTKWEEAGDALTHTERNRNRNRNSERKWGKSVVNKQEVGKLLEIGDHATMIIMFAIVVAPFMLLIHKTTFSQNFTVWARDRHKKFH